MSPPTGTRALQSPRLRSLAQSRAQPVDEPDELCELCGAPISEEHRHVLDRDTRRLLCACRPCSLLFDRRGAGGGHLRLVPDRRLRLEQFQLREEVWDALRIPVDMAFFFMSSASDRVVAVYPSPMGATESRLELDAWSEIRGRNPVLCTLEPDVEALLVNRAKGTRGYWLVPIEDCYRLVALIRTRWRGFTGGREVWLEIDRFFAELDERSRRHEERR